MFTQYANRTALLSSFALILMGLPGLLHSTMYGATIHEDHYCFETPVSPEMHDCTCFDGQGAEQTDTCFTATPQPDSGAFYCLS